MPQDKREKLCYAIFDDEDDSGAEAEDMEFQLEGDPTNCYEGTKITFHERIQKQIVDEESKKAKKSACCKKKKKPETRQQRRRKEETPKFDIDRLEIPLNHF